MPGTGLGSATLIMFLQCLMLGKLLVFRRWSHSPWWELHAVGAWGVCLRAQQGPVLFFLSHSHLPSPNPRPAQLAGDLMSHLPLPADGSHTQSSWHSTLLLL